MVTTAVPPTMNDSRTEAMVVREHELAVTCFSVQVHEGPECGHDVEADGAELSIGAAEGNQLMLTDPTVSRHHCVIVATPEGFLLRDLDSTNGTTLGGHRVREAFLTPGAVIGIGRTQLVFETETRQIRQPLSRSDRFGNAIGESALMRRLFALLERAAPSDQTVLLLGEAGTGKSLFAQTIHAQSTRRSGPFMVVDCAAIPAALIESELFGHERGAFAGALSTRTGQLEAARGGTVFLDEIGELPLDLQPKLLRVLERRVLRRMGSLEPVPIDVRIIAASSRDLRLEVNKGNFRADVFHRLNTVGVTVPPLRDRREDIPALVANFWEQLAGPNAEPPARLIGALARHDWPGNVRQLRTAVERAVMIDEVSAPDTVDTGVGSGSVTTSAPRPRPGTGNEDSGAFDPAHSFRTAKEAIVVRWERGYLTELVKRCRGNVSRAARAARMDRNHLRDLLRRHGIDASESDD